MKYRVIYKKHGEPVGEGNLHDDKDDASSEAFSFNTMNGTLLKHENHNGWLMSIPNPRPDGMYAEVVEE